MYSNYRKALWPTLTYVLLLFCSVNGALNAQINIQLFSSNPSCYQANDGAISLSISGGSSPYNIIWSNGHNGSEINNLSAGSYQVTVTDAAGLTASSSTTLVDPPAITSVFSVFNVICPGDQNGQIISTVSGGTPPYSFSWSNGAVSQNIGSLSAGNYRVTITDTNGCIHTDTAQISSPSPLSLAFSPAQPNVCDGIPVNQLAVVATGGNAPYRFNWSTGTQGPIILSPLAGTYSVTVTDTLNCTHATSITIGAFSSPVITLTEQLSVCGDTPSSASVSVQTGTPPYTYQWNNGATGASIQLNASGLYTVSVTDGNGCSTSLSRQISLVQPLDISLMTTDVSCNGLADGTASASVSGGSGAPYTYAWSNGGTTAVITGLTAGVYAATVTDGNGCNANVSTLISQPSTLSVVIRPTGACQPGLSASATGGMAAYSYLWNNGTASASIVPVNPGNYQVTVTDINGCTASGSYQLLPPSDLEAIVTVVNVSCFGDSTGSVTLTVTGAQPPYTFAWSSGESGASILSKPAGSYQVTITDDLGCSIVKSATITQPTPIQISTTEQDARCFATNTGSAAVIVSGGQQPYTYEWSNGSLDSFIVNVSANTYFITVTDSANCTAIASVTINQLPLVSVTINAQHPLCNGQPTGSATAVPSGGTPDYAYNWSNGSNSPQIDGIGPGIYNVTVTDANGCDAIAGVQITSPPPILVSLNVEATTCFDSSDGVIRATTSGGQGSLSLLWSNGQSNPILSGISAGTYGVTVSDGNGCSRSEQIELVPYPQPSCQIQLLNPIILGNDAALRVNISSGTGPFTILWNTGENSNTIVGLDTGAYSVTITDANACRSVCHYQVAFTGGIGNMVWLDNNKNGLQDSGESGISGVRIMALDESGEIVDSTQTDNNGRYVFNALLPGLYRLQFQIDSIYKFTRPNQGINEDIDSDVTNLTHGLTDLISVAAGIFLTNIDAGIYRKPRLLPASVCNCLNNATNAQNGQFSLALSLLSSAGESWHLINSSGIFSASSPVPPASPIAISGASPLFHAGAGIYTASFITVHNSPYFGILTNGFDTVIIQGLCQYPSISLISPPSGNICILDDVINLNASGSVPGNIEYRINNQVITVIDPAILPLGNYLFEARLIPTGDDCEISFFSNFSIVNDCLPLVAGRTWLDVNYNGLLEGGEPGIPNVKVVITGVGTSAPFADSTLTNGNGNYFFRVNPGSYRLRFALPPGSGLEATTPNAGSGANQRDSHIDPQSLMTPVFSLVRNQSLIDTDAGFVPPCLNITHAGSIGSNYQYLCAPGNTPQPIVNVTNPSGGTSTVPIEYIWMKSSVNSGFNSGFWEVIPGTNSPDYSPGPLFETTYFARCVRRQNCGPFLETNIVMVEVGNVTVADFTGPNLICLGQTATFQTVNAAPGATIQWSFGLGVTPITPTNAHSVTVRISSIGTFNVSLSVTHAGCTAVKRGYVTVSNSNIFCNNGLLVGATVVENTLVELNWAIPVNEIYKTFKVQYATDGLNFSEIGEVDVPIQVSGGQRHFQFVHTNPKFGINFYRIIMDNNSGNDILSNIAEAIIYGESRLVHLYPNPFTDNLTIELLESYQSGVNVDVYAANGMHVQHTLVPALTRKFELDLADLPKGVYFIRLTYDNVELKRMKVLKH